MQPLIQFRVGEPPHSDPVQAARYVYKDVPLSDWKPLPSPSCPQLLTPSLNFPHLCLTLCCATSDQYEQIKRLNHNLHTQGCTPLKAFPLPTHLLSLRPPSLTHPGVISTSEQHKRRDVRYSQDKRPEGCPQLDNNPSAPPYTHFGYCYSPPMLAETREV